MHGIIFMGMLSIIGENIIRRILKQPKRRTGYPREWQSGYYHY